MPPWPTSSSTRKRPATTWPTNGSRREPLGVSEVPQNERSEERRVGKECRSRCDWSSDVCSSDLALADQLLDEKAACHDLADQRIATGALGRERGAAEREIGRASCRERV